MTVGELIEALKAYPLDMPCVSVGFDEIGYSTLRELAEVWVGPASEWMCDFIEVDNDEGGTPALYLR